VVTSTDYPQNAWGGGSGVPGSVTFTANGVSDVAGFDHGFLDPAQNSVADQPGGSATVQLAPTATGPVDLYVRGVDRAGNLSPVYDYHFFVTDNTPLMSCTPASAGPDVPRQCAVSPRSGQRVVDYRYTYDGGFQSGLAKLVSYTYQWNDGDPVTVTADADGTASVTITPDQAGWIDLFAWAANADGVQSGIDYGSFDVQAAGS